MKTKSKILLVSIAGTLTVSGILTAVIVHEYKNYNKNNFNSIRFDSKLEAKQPEPEEPQPPIPSPEEPPVVETPEPIVEPTPAPEVPELDPEPEPEPEPEPVAPKKEQPIVSSPKKPAKPTININPDPKVDTQVPEEIVDNNLIDPSKPKPLDESSRSVRTSEGPGERGGWGTYLRHKKGTSTSGSIFEYGMQDSIQTIQGLINSGKKFKKLTEPVSSDQFKFFEENSLVFTGKEIIKINDKDIQAALAVLNHNIELQEKSLKSWVNIEKKYPRVSSLNAQELAWLKQGMWPVRMEGLWPPYSPNYTLHSTNWEMRPAFVNGTVLNMASKNLKRFIPFASIPSRSPEKVWNLEFEGYESERTGSGWDKTIESINGYDQSVARLLKYRNRQNSSEFRYIIEVISPNGISDINSLIRAAKATVGGDSFGMGLAVRNINRTTQRKTIEIVKNFDASIKSLMLFYEYNNPIVLNSLIENKNFTYKKPLEELQVFTRNPNASHDTKTLSSADPRVFWKVRPSAYDHNSSFIVEHWDIPNVDKANLSKILHNIYITNYDRREYQGSFGKGGYVPNLNMQRTQLYDLNNVKIPSMTEFSGNQRPVNFAEVIFPTVENKTLEIDLSAVNSSSDDNSKRIIKATYGEDPSQWPETVKLIGLSSRGVAADLQTLANMIAYSTSDRIMGLREEHFKTLDLSETNISEEQVRSVSFSPFIRIIKLKGGKTFKLGA